MSEFRRKLLSQKESEDVYIQDGLIIHLDCLDTANCRNNYWHSDIGNITFTGNSVYSERGFKFNGHNSGTYLVLDHSVFKNIYPYCTLEVVFETINCTSGYYLFADGDYFNGPLLQCSFNNTNLLVTTWSDKYPSTGSNGGTFNMPFPVPNNICTLSESFNGKNSKLGVLNTIRMTENTSASIFAHSGNKACIGCRYQNDSYSNWGGFSGYIKAIRMYNRALNEEEILHNQNIDSIKYNLGI